MTRQFKILIATFLMSSAISYGQNTSYEHLDTLVSDYVKELHLKGIDTICIYECYFVGASLIIKNDSDRCNYLYVYIPTYIIWLKAGTTFLSKKDNCFDYSVLEINLPNFWNIYFTNRDSIKKEKVEPFQYIYYEKKKKIVGTISVDHSGHRDFKMIIGNDTTAMAFDSFDMQQQEEFEINLNYEHNKNLKGKLFIDNLSEFVKDIENKELLKKTRR
jgi:hypothetical protein